MKRTPHNPNRQARKLKKLARTRQILCFLAELSGECLDIWYDARDFRSALLLGGPEYVKIVKKNLERKRYREAIYQLRRKRYIKVRKEGERIQIRLTKLGRQTALLDRIRSSEPLTNGEVCLVSFDIPETHRKLRAQLRRFLKTCGFRLRQKSLWMTYGDVAKPIQEAVKNIGAKKWVHIYIGRRIDD